MMTIAGVLKAAERLDSLFGKRDLRRCQRMPSSARGIALVPENRLVFPSMTVLENLHAGAYQRKNGFAEDIERLFARFPRLKERASQLAGTLSGGEQQMLAVARALMSRPKLLLMDEPSLGLAPLIVEEIFAIIAELHRDGTTIFLVEQNAHMALKVAHRFYLIGQGRVTFSGDPGSLAEDEVIRRAYLGSRQESDRPHSKHAGRADSRRFVCAARRRFHADLRRPAARQPFLWPGDHARCLYSDVDLASHRGRLAGSLPRRRGRNCARRRLRRAPVFRAATVKRRRGGASAGRSPRWWRASRSGCSSKSSRPCPSPPPLRLPRPVRGRAAHLRSVFPSRGIALDAAGRRRRLRLPCWKALYATRFGIAVRAVIDDPRAAELSGISVGAIRCASSLSPRPSAG